MPERTLLNNGRFLHNLNGWDASVATYSAGQGDDHYGVALLPTGGAYIEQSFAVPDYASYSLHLSLHGVGAAITSGQVTAVITDGDDNTVVTLNPVGAADTWSENTLTAGLAPGTTYTLRITNVSASGNVYVDDVWMWFVPITRIAIAKRTHAKLGRMATERTLHYAVMGELSEGDYTYAIDAALRMYAAINPETGSPDIRYIDAEQVQNILNAVRIEMLERLQTDYAVEVDTTTGPYRQNLSQKTQLIGEILGTGGGSQGGGSSGSGGSVIQRKLRHDNGWS